MASINPQARYRLLAKQRIWHHGQEQRGLQRNAVHGRVASTQYSHQKLAMLRAVASFVVARHSYLSKHYANSRCSFSTHRLRVERCPGNLAGHLDDRKWVPFTPAYHWRIDVNVRSCLKCVSPDESQQGWQQNGQVSRNCRFEAGPKSLRGSSDGDRLTLRGSITVALLVGMLTQEK